MKSIFLLGGFLGFALTVITGFLSQRSMEYVLRDASIACVITGFLFRWLWSVVVKNFAQAIQAKRAAEAAAEQKTAESSLEAATKQISNRNGATT